MRPHEGGPKYPEFPGFGSWGWKHPFPDPPEKGGGIFGRNDGEKIG